MVRNFVDEGHFIVQLVRGKSVVLFTTLVVNSQLQSWEHLSLIEEYRWWTDQRSPMWCCVLTLDTFSPCSTWVISWCSSFPRSIHSSVSKFQCPLHCELLSTMFSQAPPPVVFYSLSFAWRVIQVQLQLYFIFYGVVQQVAIPNLSRPVIHQSEGTFLIIRLLKDLSRMQNKKDGGSRNSVLAHCVGKNGWEGRGGGMVISLWSKEHGYVSYWVTVKWILLYRHKVMG